MTQLSQAEIKDRAITFVKEWENETREKAESQTFWNEFFNIFGINRRRVASYEEPVKKLGDRKGSIDLFWKGTMIVEHKSKGKDLMKAHDQAIDYFPGLHDEELPQYILVSDFSRFRLYDLENEKETDFSLEELPRSLHHFGFISGYKTHIFHDEDPVNIKVAQRMGELHDELLSSGYEGHPLEVLLVRLIYCLFADDTGIFAKDHFHYFLEHRMNQNGSETGAMLMAIFQILCTPPEKRQKNVDEELLEFPYINGSLFDEVLPIPIFTAKMHRVLLSCCSFDWSKVSPAVFGSMFQAVMDKEKRRNLGAHYTSEKNILKVVKGLFLDELQSDYESAKNDLNKLKVLHDRLSQLKFLDPACGCGNFLIITYRELRRLEIRILKQIDKITSKGARQLVVDVNSLSRIDVDSMFGIELEEFPARIAEVALWLVDHLMNMELSAEFGHTFVRLPLKKAANIIRGNSIQLDWKKTFSIPQSIERTNLYILGNPPFIGKKARTQEQNQDMRLVFGDTEKTGVLDYVCCWYAKANSFIKNSKSQVAFVSTNSITQGEQVGVLWEYLGIDQTKVNFAHRTFRWSNEARGKAAVFCVIIGFASFDKASKRIFDYADPNSDPVEIIAKQINPYLVDAEIVLIESRSKPICDVPELKFGSMPNDDGNYLLTEEEKVELLKKEPNANRFIRPILSSYEFLNGKDRYCLWLIDAQPEEIRALPEIRRRVDAVRKFRESSKREATVKLADSPSLFGEIRQPESNYVLIPRHSSETRKYIPIAIFDTSYIASDSCVTMPNATLYHFGVLQSIMHMTWTKQICGRIKGDYRYSNNVVFNNFIWPESPSEKQKQRVEDAARNLLEIRARFKKATLADLYDPNAMPKTLLDAHNQLDSVVDSCYRQKKFSTDLERLDFLFALYKKYTSPLVK